MAGVVRTSSPENTPFEHTTTHTGLVTLYPPRVSNHMVVSAEIVFESSEGPVAGYWVPVNVAGGGAPHLKVTAGYRSTRALTTHNVTMMF